MVGSPVSVRKSTLLKLTLCMALAVLVSITAASAAGFSQNFKAADLGPRTISVDIASYQQVRYVSQTAGSDATGTGSVKKPWATVKKAVSATSDAGYAKRYAIIVASGSYTVSNIQMKPFVDIYGGFEPKTWTRDIFAHKSILDGKGAGRVILGANNSRLDGFTVRGGKSRSHGGAILCDRTSPEITNNIFIDNQTIEPEGYVYGLLHQVGSDGGAIACLNDASPKIANNIFYANKTAIGGGGAIVCRNLSLPVIENNVFADNLTGTKDNDPNKDKRARSSNGAAISCTEALPRGIPGGTMRMKITGNLIINNRVGGNSDAGGIYCEYDSWPEITGNYILGNVAEDDGGGIYIMKSSQPDISENVIAGNKGGGAIRLSKEGRALIKNNLIYANMGGLGVVDSWTTVEGNIIAENGRGGVGYENFRVPLKPSIFKNNIICGHTDKSISANSPDPLVLENNSLQEEYPGNSTIGQAIPFVDDAITGTLVFMNYDKTRFQTRMRLETGSGSGNVKALVGRVIHVGEKWSVICSADGQSITAWGDLRIKSGKSVDFEIPKTYTLKK